MDTVSPAKHFALPAK